MTISKWCGCCGESVWPLELREGLSLCLDCLKVYDEGTCHRWDQIKDLSLARKEERRGK